MDANFHKSSFNIEAARQHFEQLAYGQAEDNQTHRLMRQSSSPVEIRETKDRVTIRIEMAGVKKSCIRVIVNDTFVRVRYDRFPVMQANRDRLIRYESNVQYGRFCQVIPIPPIACGEACAEYIDGILRIDAIKAAR